MARNIRIIHARDIICARPDGALDLEASEKLIREIAGASAPLADFDLVVDTRNATSRLSASDLWFLADRLISYRKSPAHKIAVLCPAERFDHASFFAMCAEKEGFNMQAFTSFEDAMDWLAAENGGHGRRAHDGGAGP